MLNNFICQHCVANKYLHEEIVSRGMIVANCPICKRGKGFALSTDDKRLARIVRSLIRLNFSEWHYNTHLGGVSLQGLIFSSKTIFNFPENADEIAFEEAFLKMEEGLGWYPKTDDDISLGGGYWDGGILEGLREQRDSVVTELIKSSLHRNSHEIEPKARQIIQSLKEDITLPLHAGQKYFRGRLGVQSRMRKRDTSPTESPFSYLPFSGGNIGSPPMLFASEGRLNRARISILYLASDRTTAVAELRPHPGHFISTAEFSLERDIVVANFVDHDIRNFLSDRRLEDLRTILSVSDILNVPVQPEHRFLYVVTQLIADAVRAEGYDGLMFSSSTASGFNVAIFDPNVAMMVISSEEIQEVRSLTYQLRAVPTLNQDYNPDTYKKDDDSALATLLHGMAVRL
ncbi:RES family NAD+ phosphorylase [Delftia acidovorans]|uniref:RES family NAD+ phosphorylase n=1 Tax=Delftia acidovorans TaxID=80866 RepID=UPI0018E82073|nr:RES family NAD+ phosphorylase [Delftia acidovorans]MBJ2139334.1 RES family NAD+ phosphorylase [Delftia acidovorans]MCG3786024.1 RES family NAD+ phosphorylase [Delftia acidovorans]